MKEIYDWVPWFRELAQKIAENDDQYLIDQAKLVNWRENGTQKLLKYGDKNIDPFSFVYTIASFNTGRSRDRVFSSVTKVFGLNEILPFDLENAFVFPKPIPQNLLFHQKGEGNPALLWKLFRAAVGSIDKIDSGEFDKVLKIGNVGITKLTQTLFLINPKEFLPYDSSWKNIVSPYPEQEPRHLDEYRNYIDQAKISFPNCDFNEINFFAFHFAKTLSNPQFFIINTKVFGDKDDDFWNEFNDENSVRTGGPGTDRKLYPLREPNIGDVILVRTGNKGRGIGVVQQNDYNSDRDLFKDWDEKARIHVVWINKAEKDLATDSKQAPAFCYAYDATKKWFELLPEYEPTFKLINEISGKEIQSSEKESISENSNIKQMPINKILYGPPGTGKTFHTAKEAIKLCGETPPNDRKELMKIYQKLVEQGRIEFVTFHQSMSYEDFVEGRQPTTESDEGSDSSTAGFHLKTESGIFRRLARRAEMRRERRDEPILIEDINRKRGVFKITIQEDLMMEAIRENYVFIGLEGIDWSHDKYTDLQEITNKLKEKEGYKNVDSLWWMSAYINNFRNKMQIGDIVIISKDNLEFQAIGEITGNYEYESNSNSYPNRRSVRWLYKDEQGVSNTEIYKRKFAPRKISSLAYSDLNIAALKRYVNTLPADHEAEPEPFVLIIDEINRANISKVFGELITLLEPDKRLGEINELKVRLPYSGTEFGIPSNLHILGTMNTADRSIALLDTALRRRFQFHELMPDPSLLKKIGDTCGLDLPKILTTINERIEYLYDREHQIGHAYFMHCRSKDDVDEVMRDRIIPLLSEYFFEDWSKVAAVLGDAQTHEGKIVGGFLNRYVLEVPPGLEDRENRYRWVVRSDDEGFNYEKLTE